MKIPEELDWWFYKATEGEGLGYTLSDYTDDDTVAKLSAWNKELGDAVKAARDAYIKVESFLDENYAP